MQDLYSNIGAVQAIAPSVLTASVNSPGLDLLGFEGATFVISTGAITGTGTVTAKIQETDPYGEHDFAGPYYDISVQGDSPITLAANSVYKIGYLGFQRFIRLVFTLDSGVTIAASAVLIKGHPHERPVS